MNLDAEAQARLATLHEWQRHYNMSPRDDSALTRRFVRGEIDWPVDMVARELMATDFIYKATLYGEYIERYMRAMAHRLREEHPRLTWTQTWDIVQFYGPLSLKLLMLLQCEVQIPPHL